MEHIVRGLKVGSVGLAAGTLFAVTGGLAAPGIAAGLAASGLTATAAAAAEELAEPIGVSCGVAVTLILVIIHSMSLPCCSMVVCTPAKTFVMLFISNP